MSLSKTWCVTPCDKTPNTTPNGSILGHLTSRGLLQGQEVTTRSSTLSQEVLQLQGGGYHYY